MAGRAKRQKRTSVLVETFFYILERLLTNMNSPGGRILIMLLLVCFGLIGASNDVPGARQIEGGATVALLLMFTRRTQGPSLLNALLKLLKREGPL